MAITATPGNFKQGAQYVVPNINVKNVFDTSDPTNPKRLDAILSELESGGTGGGGNVPENVVTFMETGTVPGEVVNSSTGIQTFTYAKTLTVHQLTGPAESKFFTFKATADYLEGDTWTLNGNPITVNFRNGNPLCVGGMINGDTMLGRIDNDVITFYNNQAESGTNILDNWYFVNPINQRNQTSYTDSVNVIYTIDRWKMMHNGTLAINSNSIRMTKNNAAGNSVALIQVPENYVVQQDTKLTLSFLGKGTATIARCVINTGSSNTENAMIPKALTDSWQLYTHTVSVPANTTVNSIYIQLMSGNAANTYVDILAAKLEVGSRQTLAHKDTSGNWVLNDAPPSREVELSKCQRYLIRIDADTPYSNVGIGVGNPASGNVRAVFFVETTVPLRNTNPTLFLSGDWSITSDMIVANDIDLTGLSLSNINNTNSRFCVVTNENNSITSGTNYFLRHKNDTSASMFLSCDL